MILFFIAFTENYSNRGCQTRQVVIFFLRVQTYVFFSQQSLCRLQFVDFHYIKNVQYCRPCLKPKRFEKRISAFFALFVIIANSSDFGECALGENFFDDLWQIVSPQVSTKNTAMELRLLLFFRKKTFPKETVVRRAANYCFVVANFSEVEKKDLSNEKIFSSENFGLPQLQVCRSNYSKT